MCYVKFVEFAGFLAFKHGVHHRLTTVVRIHFRSRIQDVETIVKQRFFEVDYQCSRVILSVTIAKPTRNFIINLTG